MRTNGSPYHLSARLISPPQASIMVNSKQVPPAVVRIFTGARLGTEVRRGAATSEASSTIHRTGAGHLPFDVACLLNIVCPPPSSRPGSGRFDSSHRGCHIATGQARRNDHSPYSEPAVLVASYEATSAAPRPRSSSAALDRGRPAVSQVSCPSVPRFTQLAYVDTPSRYPQLHLASHSRKHVTPYISSREHSPDSRASFSPSPADSPSVRGQLQIGTVPSPHSSNTVATSASGTRVPSQMGSFINSMPMEAQDATMTGVAPTRRRTSPVRKRKASEMVGASPGSEERAISLEPSESEAKKKYKKKMNVRHYRAQNKDAMTQLRDVLPERMRPPERQAKAYVTLSGTSCVFFFFEICRCLESKAVSDIYFLPRSNQIHSRAHDRE